MSEELANVDRMGERLGIPLEDISAEESSRHWAFIRRMMDDDETDIDCGNGIVRALKRMADEEEGKGDRS